MIVDTSALVAVLRREDGHAPMLDALVGEDSLLPTPVLLEFARVTASAGKSPNRQGDDLVVALLSGRMALQAFDADAARLAAAANEAHGRGNGRGGLLNVLDLMVLGCAHAARRPILCTGRDFAASGAEIHPASRPW